MKVLKLTIKKQWFDMLLSGEKKEEYREIKPYWITRLTTGETRHFLRIQGANKYHYKKYDYVEFTNGYGKDKPSATFECRGIAIGKGNPKWGAPAEDVFIIKLGEEVSRSNC